MHSFSVRLPVGVVQKCSEMQKNEGKFEEVQGNVVVQKMPALMSQKRPSVTGVMQVGWRDPLSA